MAKTYHHGDLRAALIDEALTMIRADEAHLIGFRELARRLDVSRTAPYRHFESVEALLSAVAEEGYELFLERLKKVNQTQGYTDAQRFVELGIAYVEFAREHPAHYRLIFDPRFFAEDGYPKIKDLAAKAFSELQKTSAQCLPPQANASEKQLVAQLSWSCVHGISSLLMNGQMRGMRKPERFIRQSCERLLSIAGRTKDW